MDKRHVVLFSTGLSSAFVLDRVQQECGKENTVALFTDTLWEDEDNYRFMREVIAYLGATLEYRADGRTPEQVWFDTRFLIAPKGTRCTIDLKTKLTVRYVEEATLAGFDPMLYFGIGANEAHRAVGLGYRYAPAECRFPLIDHPLTNQEMTIICEREWGIQVPRMYKLGFSHANCGGRCIKGGQSHWRHLLNIWPERYAEVEEIERRFRREINGDIAILQDRRGGEKRYVTLEEFRKRVAGRQQCLLMDEYTPCECVF